ncbi:MAG: 6-carboxytetrahydropterin synthase QueD [Pseudomonadota bacterium]
MPGVYEIYVKAHFSAAHALTGYPGDCSRLHGHNWNIEVFVRCSQLDEVGIGVDFRDITRIVKRVVDNLDHCHLNELPPFHHHNPTSENVARYLYRELSAVINADGVRISRVKVSETPEAGAIYWEE